MENITQCRQAVPPALPGEADGLLAIMAGKRTISLACQDISRRFRGKSCEILQKILKTDLSHANCVKGIYTLITGENPLVQPVPPVPEAPETMLRRCYGNEMRALAAFEARREDPRYGPVYAVLTEETREHCKLFLELLGAVNP